MKTLKKFEFKTTTSSGAKHDWAKLLDGGIYQLTAGEDYTGNTGGFSSTIKLRGQREGKVVEVNRVEGGIVIKAGSPDAAAAAEFNAHEAELKAGRKVRKAESNGDEAPAE